jgi:hypothetical protein
MMDDEAQPEMDVTHKRPRLSHEETSMVERSTGAGEKVLPPEGGSQPAQPLVREREPLVVLAVVIAGAITLVSVDVFFDVLDAIVGVVLLGLLLFGEGSLEQPQVGMLKRLAWTVALFLIVAFVIDWMFRVAFAVFGVNIILEMLNQGVYLATFIGLFIAVPHVQKPLLDLWRRVAPDR